MIPPSIELRKPVTDKLMKMAQKAIPRPEFAWLPSDVESASSSSFDLSPSDEGLSGSASSWFEPGFFNTVLVPSFDILKACDL